MENEKSNSKTENKFDFKKYIIPSVVAGIGAFLVGDYVENGIIDGYRTLWPEPRTNEFSHYMDDGILSMEEMNNIAQNFRYHQLLQQKPGDFKYDYGQNVQAKFTNSPDVNGGRFQTYSIDANKDGKPEWLMEAHSDGSQNVHYDFDSDGIADLFFDYKITRSADGPHLADGYTFQYNKDLPANVESEIQKIISRDELALNTDLNKNGTIGN